VAEGDDTARASFGVYSKKISQSMYFGSVEIQFSISQHLKNHIVTFSQIFVQAEDSMESFSQHGNYSSLDFRKSTLN
jgi:hypothetical protein